MTNVWYVGRYGKRQLSIGDWAQLGVVTTKQNVSSGFAIGDILQSSIEF